MMTGPEGARGDKMEIDKIMSGVKNVVSEKYFSL